MKKPKAANRYCPFCKKKTNHKIKQLSTGIKRGTLTRGSMSRARKRGLGRGYGNLGRYGSKPPINKWKRKIKNTKKPYLFILVRNVEKHISLEED